MKTLNNYITESAMANYFNPDWDIKPYMTMMLDMWLKNVNGYNVSGLGEKYNKVMLCRRCAELVYILDKFSDDITIHFVQADKPAENTKAVLYCGCSFGDRLANAFNVIEAAINIGDEPELKDDESVKDTIAELRKDFNNIVKKYNKKYNEKMNKAKEAGEPVPCDCECCCGCCDCEAVAPGC